MAWLIIGVMEVMIYWLTACRSVPSLTPLPTASSSVQSSTPTLMPTSTPTRLIIDGQALSSLRDPLTFQLSEFDTLTINMPTRTPLPPRKVSASLLAPIDIPTAVPVPVMKRTPSSPARCPPLGNPSVLWQDHERLMHAYLNAGGVASDLEKLLNWEENIQNGSARAIGLARVFHTDVTGDSVPDVLVSYRTSFRYYVPDIRLFFSHCRDGQYEGGLVLSLRGGIDDTPTNVLNPDHGVWGIQDMNGNGVPEIVFSYMGFAFEGSMAYVGGSLAYVFILEWDGNQMVHLVNHGNYTSSIAAHGIGFVPGGGRIVDVDGNGTLELVIQNSLSCREEIGQADRIEVYAWDGHSFSLTYTEELTQSMCH